MSCGIPAAFQVLVRHEHTHAIGGLRASDDATALLSAVAEATGMPQRAFWLATSGRRIEAGRTLRSYALTAGSTVHLAVRGRGGVCMPSGAEHAPAVSAEQVVMGDSERPRPPVTPQAGGARASSDALTALSRLDDRVVERLRAGDIRLLRVSWLVQPSVVHLSRRQELERLEREGEGEPFLSAEEAEAALRKHSRCIGALTYGWLSPGDPDPAGRRLAVLKAACAQQPYLEGLFWDYGSLHQVACRRAHVTRSCRLLHTPTLVHPCAFAHADPARRGAHGPRGRRLPTRSEGHGGFVRVRRRHHRAANPGDPAAAGRVRRVQSPAVF